MYKKRCSVFKERKHFSPPPSIYMEKTVYFIIRAEFSTIITGRLPTLIASPKIQRSTTPDNTT